MHYVFYILTGILSGILGGMGMGGGTLLIPLLTFIFGFNQRLAQGINLISFSIMAILVLLIHIKNKMVDIKAAITFACFAIATTILGAILANLIHAKYLKICFGLLLILISVYQAIQEIKYFFTKKQTVKKK